MTREEMERNMLVRNASFENDFVSMLSEIASVLPLAHTVFSQEQSLPYSIWNESDGEFIFADGKIVRGRVGITLEVYHAVNDTVTIPEIETILKQHDKLQNSQSFYINSEKCKMTTFDFTVRKDVRNG